ncbi:MAG: guanylate kinase [Fimbriimonas sp.]
MSSGRLLILSGPSGVGKDTLLDAWHGRNPRVQRVIAYTTRAVRPGETDGIDYHFVSPDRFHELAAGGHFLEHKEVHGNFYATPLTDMERMLAEGRFAILKIDVQGALDVMTLRPDALAIFLLPPSMDELERRIRCRGTEDEAAITKRLQNARDEIALSERYHRRVVNDDLERALAELESIARGEA